MKEITCKCGATMPEELLQVHVRANHTEYWRHVEHYLQDTEVKLAQLEDVANTRSRGWSVFEPIIKEPRKRTPHRLAVYDLTEEAIVTAE